jgi:peptidoglycan hydrolase CwlO-like protein
MKNILTVIDELGALIENYKDEIKYKDYEIDSLKKKITEIENYIDFYSKE